MCEKQKGFVMSRNETMLMCSFLAKITNKGEFKGMTEKMFREDDPALKGIDFEVFYNEKAFEKTNDIMRRMLDYLVTNEEALAEMER